jgi:hypothetical protein
MRRVLVYGAMTALILAASWQMLPVPADAG